jgi:UDP-N-acetylglucosamine 2-epimerase
MSRTILHIVGARPQFVKYFAVSNAIRAFAAAHSESIIDVLVHTGQHYDYSMSKIFFDELGIKEPEFHLEVGSGPHGEQTAKVLQRFEETLLKVKPACVLVYGDTNSTLGGALAAVKLHIPVCHVEAGLRSYNKSMPEEINRILTDHSSTVLFCPSNSAVDSLRKEGFTKIVNNGKLVSEQKVAQEIVSSTITIDSPLVVNVGDVMYDVLLHATAIAEKRSAILQQLQLTPKKYFLLTLHRAENTDNPQQFEEIISFVNTISAETPVIFPMHPRTKNVYERSSKRFGNNVRIIEPAGYFDVLTLLKNSALLLTDSGGMQKEAYWLQTQCITLRKETEWVETLEGGWNTLYTNFTHRAPPSSNQSSAYGDGKAAEKIIAVLHKLL